MFLFDEGRQTRQFMRAQLVAEKLGGLRKDGHRRKSSGQTSEESANVWLACRVGRRHPQPRNERQPASLHPLGKRTRDFAETMLVGDLGRRRRVDGNRDVRNNAYVEPGLAHQATEALARNERNVRAPQTERLDAIAGRRQR